MARSRLASAALAAALLGGVGLPAVVTAPVASAHSVLLEIDPADGATVETSPEQVALTFNEEINQSFATVAVTADAGDADLAVGEPVVEGDTVTAEVDDLDPGLYTVGYRVTSADGHVVNGSSTFTVGAARASTSATSPGQATSGESAAPASDTAVEETPDATASDDSTSGIGTALWVVGGLAVLLLGGAIILLRRGR